MNTGGSDALAVAPDTDYGTAAAKVLWRHYHQLGSRACEPTTPYWPTALDVVELEPA